MHWALVLTVAKVGIPLLLMGVLPVLILMERRGAAYVQDRPGPNRAGLLQALQKKAANKAVELRGDGPLVPLALRGVSLQGSAASLLRRNLLIYGLGGLIVPFIGIKLIDLVITGLGLV